MKRLQCILGLPWNRCLNYKKKCNWYRSMCSKKKYTASIMGLVIGDALGVPVEFVSRDELKDNPVTDMIGYGTHNQPAGTWSDDSSMAVATMEWLGEIETQQPDYKQLMDKFSNWILYGDYTPYQENFDCGISTCKAIMNYGRGTEPLLCGERESLIMEMAR